MSNILIEKIKTDEFEQIAHILTDAFEANPAYSLIFNHTNKLREGLLWLFQTNLYLINRTKLVTNVIKNGNTNEIIGTFSLIPPDVVKNTFFDYLHIGLPRFILKFGIKSLSKLLGMNKFNKDILSFSIQTKEYYYLSMLVIKEEYRGKGIGSFAVKNCLNELSQTNGTCRLLALTTQLPENVSFYSQLGFTTIDEGLVSFKENEYYNWNMKYVF